MKKKLKHENDKTLKYSYAQKRLGALNVNNDILQDEFNKLIKDNGELLEKYNSIKQEHEKLKAKYKLLRTTNKIVIDELTRRKNE